MIQSSVVKSKWRSANGYSTGLTAKNSALTSSRSIFPGAPGAKIFGPMVTSGGHGIYLENSRAFLRGTSADTDGKKLVLRNSTATKLTPALPMLTSSSFFAAGAQTSFQIQAEPQAVSVTWLTLRSRPLATPLGYLVADMQTLIMPLATVHDAKGLGTLTLDLRYIAKRPYR